MVDPLPLLEQLDIIRSTKPEQLTHMYQKLFGGTTDGQMVLVDLMEQFFEFKPTSNDREAGSQAVLIYIKNRLLGITDQLVETKGESQ